MKLEKLSNTAHILHLNLYKEILFSYEIPVAAYVHGRWMKTDTFYSKTTSGHINKYLGEIDYEIVPQAELDDIWQKVDA